MTARLLTNGTLNWPAGAIFSHRDPSRRTGYPYVNFVTD
jgi:hypothetical protein